MTCRNNDTLTVYSFKCWLINRECLYVVNGDLGYRFLADTKDQNDFEIYLPVFKDMLNSVEIK